VDRFWLRKVTTDPYIVSHVNVGCKNDRYPDFKICISEVISDSYGYIPCSIRKKVLNDLSLALWVLEVS
jgi:hypothetical protein